MRAGARAALAALAGLTDDEVTMELRGTKAVRAFDSLVVVAAVRVRDGDGRRDLIGAVRAPDDDLVRGGILAALDAVNRFLGQRLQAPSPEGAPESDPESDPEPPS